MGQMKLNRGNVLLGLSIAIVVLGLIAVSVVQSCRAIELTRPAAPTTLPTSPDD